LFIASLIRRTAVRACAVYDFELLPAGHPGRDVIAEAVGRIDVKCGAAGEFHRIFDLKLVQLLEQDLPNVGNSHLAANPDFHD
jgi:hypothetical protein